MERFLTFLSQIPFWCGAKNPERWAEAIRLVFDKELKDPSSSFAESAEDKRSPWNRIELPFSFSVPLWIRSLSLIRFSWIRAILSFSPRRYRYASRLRLCKQLVLIKVLSHRIKEHGDDGHIKLRDKLLKEAMLSKDKGVTDTYTALDAVNSWWDEWNP